MSCGRLLDELAQAEVNRQSQARVARPALMRLVPFLDREGIRPSELARRADVSKQAVGQTLRDCEALGLVRFSADPSDGRAQLVQLTDAGETAFRYGQSVLAFFERALAGAVGAATVVRVASGLSTMLPVLQSWAASGAPEQRRSADRAPFHKRTRLTKARSGRSASVVRR
jgi:DNA-binding MarR family transcriptional regulator